MKRVQLSRGGVKTKADEPRNPSSSPPSPSSPPLQALPHLTEQGEEEYYSKNSKKSSKSSKKKKISAPTKSMSQVQSKLVVAPVAQSKVDIGWISNPSHTNPSTDRPPLPFTPDNLRTAKSDLKSILDAEKEQIILDRTKLFDCFNSPNHYPLERLPNLFSVDNAIIMHVDLTGVEQLSDVFFVMLHKQQGGSQFALNLSRLTLQGCVNITDISVQFITKTFTRLQTIVFTGCRRLTEKSLTLIQQTYKRLELVIMSNTDVCVVNPPNLTSVYYIRVEGCPLISPPACVYKPDFNSILPQNKYFTKLLADEPPWTMYKCLIINSQTTQFSLVNSLSAEKLTESDASLLAVQQNFSVGEDIVVNILECSEVLADLFISDRAVFILPYDAHLDIENIVDGLIRRLVPILTKIQFPVVTLVGLAPGSSESVPADQVLARINEQLRKICKALKLQEAAFSNQVNVRQQTISYAEQERLGNIYRLLNGLDMVEFTYNINLQEGQTMDALKTSLANGIALLRGVQPAYEKMPSQFAPILINSVPCSEGLHTEFSIISELRNKHRDAMGTNYRVYRKVLQILHLVGKLIYFEDSECPMVVTDIKWFSAQLQSSFTGNSFNGLSKEMVKLIRNTGLACPVSEDIVSEPELTWSSKLPTSYPLMPMEYFIEMEQSDAVCTLRFQYRFLHRLANSLMLEILAAVANMDFHGKHAYPPLVWQTGLVILNGPVTIALSFAFLDTPESRIILVAQVVKPRSKEEERAMRKCLWNSLELYRTPIEYVIHKKGLYFVFEETFIGDQLQSQRTEKAMPSQKPDNIVGVTFGHSFEACERKHGVTDNVCTFCRITETTQRKLWKFRQTLLPTFQSAQTTPIVGSIQCKGCWINTSVGEVSIPLPTMCVSDFSEFSLTILSGGKTLKIRMQSPLNLKIRHYEFNIDDLLILKHRSSAVDGGRPTLLERGDIITMRLNRPANDGLKTVELLLLHNGEQLYSVIEDKSSKFMPFILTNEQATFLVDASVAAKLTKAESWEVGMRLEAMDRKHRDLGMIAVASIKAISPVGELLIHFDGWSSDDDYWAEPSSTDLHPIGFLAQRIYGHSEYSRTLTAPKDYQKVQFSWEEYLVDVVAIPAPYSLFTRDQTEGCAPFVLNRETINFLNSNGKGVAAHDQCHLILERPITYLSHVMDRWLVGRNDRYESPVPVFLPADLSRVNLLWPSNADLSRVNPSWPSNENGITFVDKLRWYFICTGQPDVWHFLDIPGLLPKERISDQHIQAVCSVVTSTDIHVKQNIKLMIKNIDDLLAAKIERGLQVLFYIYAWNLFLLRTENSDSETDPEIIKINNSKLLGSIWNEYKDSDAVKKCFEMGKSDGSHMAVGLSPMCTVHQLCHSAGKELREIQLGDFSDHFNLISILDLSSNLLELLPGNFFVSFPVLQSLNLSKNRLLSLPLGIGACKSLAALHLSNNKLSHLPTDFSAVSGSLKILVISHNPLLKIPESILLETLEELDAANIGAIELPADIGKMTYLKILNLSENALIGLPPSFSILSNVTNLDLSGIRWFDSTDLKMLLTRDTFNEFVQSNHCLANRSVDQLFLSIDVKGRGILNYQEVQRLNIEIFQMFPRFGQNTPSECGGIPHEIFSLRHLRSLNLSFHGLVHLTSHIKELAALEELILSNNPTLEVLPAEVALLKSLKEMPLRGCPLLKTPPKEIIRRGFAAVIGYLRRLEMGAVECKRTKLMMVGLGGAGKTSLVHSLTSSSNVSTQSFDAKITDGIAIRSWTVKHELDNVTFSVWDFAGQAVYYNTHQFFMSNRAVYLLVWNIRLGYEHAGIDFWLSSIACHAPKAPIFVIGSHKDQVYKYWIPESIIKQRYPQICGFFAISAFSGEGVAELRQQLAETALKEKYMGEKIPEVWFNFERKMLTERANYATLTWEQVEDCAYASGIADKTEIAQAVQFLHDLGSIQHFDNEYLRSRVIINPQWIVDAMSRIVSVANTPIKDGRFYHSDLSLIWDKYSEDIRQWLLRLTEEFDLTFPSKEENANIVPCLLPSEEPNYSWPDIGSMSGIKELRLTYSFDYLPAGLFNRVQVRLYQYSDSSQMWQNGSFLHKNGHYALLTTEDSKNVAVIVRGPRPENILFLVHEVFEALIAESFRGVHYDYFVPCSDCIKAGALEPSMFPATRIRRAIELKASFLQCSTHFHMLSLAELHATMPPDDNSDFDVHLERSLQDLSDLRQDLTYDVFLIYCTDNIPQNGEDTKKIAPRKILHDLQVAGMKVWFSADPNSISIEQVALTMREAKVVAVCLSNEFVVDERCRKLFHMAKNSMQKTLQIVALGSDLQFLKSSDIGILVSTELYINMTDQAVHRYPSKIVELCNNVKSKVRAAQTTAMYPKVFLSYCWANSHDAIKKGTKEQPGSLGWGDPRKIKDFLDENCISCWLDIERVSKGQLFEEIADGLRHAAVMIVCASSEYAKSRNCLMEFRFACITLNLPLIVLAVGTGNQWENSEVGMLTLGSAKISFQYENSGAYKSLLEALEPYVSKKDIEQERNLVTSPSVGPDNNQLAFQELLELAQRKFLCQVSLYADSMESGSYPRLFLLDYLTDEEQKTIPDGTEIIKSLRQSDGTVDFMKEAIAERSTSNRSSVKTQQSTDGKSANNKVDQPLFCIRTLCEHEEGWHCMPNYVVLEMTDEHTDWKRFLTDTAAYMSRFIALLRYTTMSLEILSRTSKRAEQLRKTLDEKCGSDPDFKAQYSNLRKMMMKTVPTEKPAEKRKDLFRCRLLSGKISWLCHEHCKRERITILADETADNGSSADTDAADLSIMAEALFKKRTEDGNEEKSNAHIEDGKNSNFDLVATGTGKEFEKSKVAKIAAGIKETQKDDDTENMRRDRNTDDKLSAHITSARDTPEGDRDRAKPNRAEAKADDKDAVSAATAENDIKKESASAKNNTQETNSAATYKSSEIERADVSDRRKKKNNAEGRDDSRKADSTKIRNDSNSAEVEDSSVKIDRAEVDDRNIENAETNIDAMNAIAPEYEQSKAKSEDKRNVNKIPIFVKLSTSPLDDDSVTAVNDEMIKSKKDENKQSTAAETRRSGSVKDKASSAGRETDVMKTTVMEQAKEPRPMPRRRASSVKSVAKTSSDEKNDDEKKGQGVRDSLLVNTGSHRKPEMVSGNHLMGKDGHLGKSKVIASVPGNRKVEPTMSTGSGHNGQTIQTSINQDSSTITSSVSVMSMQSPTVRLDASLVAREMAARIANGYDPIDSKVCLIM